MKNDEELIGGWENPELGGVEVQYWDSQKTRILVNGLTEHGELNFAGPYTVISPRKIRIRDQRIADPFELHLDWAGGRLDLYVMDVSSQTIHPEFQFQFTEFHGDGSFDLPTSASPCGIGELNLHGQAMVRSLTRLEGESLQTWVKRLKTMVPELELSEPASIENPESYPPDLVNFWAACGGMELGMFPIVHSPNRLDERTAFVQPNFPKPIVMVNDTDGWGYCLSTDSSDPFLIYWNHEVDFKDSREISGTLFDIIAERIAEIATVYPPFDLTYNKVFPAIT